MHQFLSRAKWVGLSLLALSAFASSANAQGFAFRPHPAGWQTYGYFARSYGFQFPSPTGGYGFQFRQYSYRQNTLGTVRPIYPLYVNPGYGYSRSTSSFAGGFQADREQLALQQAQRANRNDPIAIQRGFDAWAVEKGAGSVPMDILEKATPAVKAALGDANANDVASGVAINRVLAAIQELEAKGLKANPPFFPAELITKVEYEGAQSASAMNLFRDEKLQFPVSLQAPRYDAVRGLLERDFEAAVKQVRAGKKLDLYLNDQLIANAKRLNKLHPANEGEGGTEFATNVENVFKYLLSPEATGLIVGSWHTLGANASDFAQHAKKYKLTIGHAAFGDEDAYVALYRGLVSYLSELAQAKR